MFVIRMLVLLTVWIANVAAFSHSLHKMNVQRATSVVTYMGGGRSPAEKNMSKRQMFLALREKLNKAAQSPGFFEVGEGTPVSLLLHIATQV